VDISFDSAKNALNIARHGISMERALEFEWHDAIVDEDSRRDYGEHRYQALGRIATRLHMLIYTPRHGGVHVISLRKANRREERRYAKETKEKANSNGSRKSILDRRELSSRASGARSAGRAVWPGNGQENAAPARQAQERRTTHLHFTAPAAGHTCAVEGDRARLANANGGVTRQGKVT